MKIEGDGTSLITATTSDLDLLASMLERGGTRFRVVATCSWPEGVREQREFPWKPVSALGAPRSASGKDGR